MAEQASLQFKGYEITRVVFEKSIGFLGDKFNVNFQHLNRLSKIDKNRFSTEFIITITSTQDDKNFNLQVQTLGHFEIVGNVED